MSPLGAPSDTASEIDGAALRGVFRITLPTLPNAPSLDRPAGEDHAPFALRRNRRTGFVENAAFDPARIAYGPDYHNEQHGSAAFRAHMGAMADLVAATAGRDAAIVEVGCGKGAFFELLDARGFRNLRGFDTSYAGDDPRIERRYVTADDRLAADLIVLRHTLEHVREPHRLLATLAAAAGSGAKILIEVPCFDWIRAAGSLWDLTYEHVNYFTATSLAALFRNTDRLTPVFAGQYLALVADLGALDPNFGEAYRDASAWSDVDLAPFFARFDRLTERRLGAGSGRLFVWGAGTKGVLLCHYLATRAPHLELVSAIDINPAKQGRYTPGAGRPIRAPAAALADAQDGDTVVVCNPNYLAEVRALASKLTDRRIAVEPLE